MVLDVREVYSVAVEDGGRGGRWEAVSKRWGPCVHVVVDRHFWRHTEDVGIRSENLAVTARVRPLLLFYFRPS